MGKRHGDNQQLIAIAEALRMPFRVIALRLNRAAKIPAPIRGASHVGWRTDEPLRPPWPRIVLAAGGKSAPAARWIRKQSGGVTKLVHVNRPWAPLSQFDLVVTTPQYALPKRPNVLANVLPFLPPKLPPTEVVLPDVAAAMPRPWTVVLIGGKTRPYAFTDAEASALAKTANEQVGATGGSVWLIDSPRTPPDTLASILKALKVPSHAVSWREGKEIYNALLASADRFVVTEDSISMMTEALLSGQPVRLFALPMRPTWGSRLAFAWRIAAERSPASLTARIFDAVTAFGLLTSVRDVRLVHRALEQEGLLDGGVSSIAWAERERQSTLARIRALLS